MLFFGGFAFWRKAREEHYDEREVTDVLLRVTLLGLVAARVGYVLLHFEQFGMNSWQWLAVTSKPGLSYATWLVVSSLLLFRTAQEKRWDTYEVLDFWSLSLVAAQVWLWLGFFLSGSYVGISTNLPWGVQFPAVFDARHPVQLYVVGASLALYYFLAWAEYNYRMFSWYRGVKKTARTGFLWGSYAMFTGLMMMLFQPLVSTTISIAGIHLGWIVYPAFALYGAWVLVMRSGMELWGLRDVWQR